MSTQATKSFAALRRSQQYTVKAPWLLIFTIKIQQIGKFTNMEPANNEDYLLQSVPERAAAGGQRSQLQMPK